MGEPKDLCSLFKGFLEGFDSNLAVVDNEAARARLRPYFNGFEDEEPDVIDFALRVVESQNKAATSWRNKFDQMQKDYRRAVEERDAARTEGDRARSNWQDAELRLKAAEEYHPFSDAYNEAARARLREYWQGGVPEKPDVIDFAMQVVELLAGPGNELVQSERKHSAHLNLLVDSFEHPDNAPGNPTANKLARILETYKQMEDLLSSVADMTKAYKDTE